MHAMLLALALVSAGADTGARAPLPGRMASVSGRVTDPDGNAIVAVRVTILEASRSTRTDDEGRYSFGGLGRGTYGLSFSRIGFAPRVIRLRVSERDTTVGVVLRPTLVELPDLQVTASPLATTALNSPQPTSVITSGDLATTGAPSLGETASVMPGLRSVSTGAGIGKPVIRGLTSNRILILADGQRLETQQWGDEHGPNVETADAERIEVIRGPASVLYGSDALGGVINVVDRDLPDAVGKSPFVRGRAQAAYSTGTRMPDGTLAVEGAMEGFGFRVSGTGRSSGDTRTPLGPLANSAIETLGGEASAGLRGSWGAAHLTFAHRNERLELHEDPAEDPDATPFQRIGEDRLHLEMTLPVAGAHVDVDAGYERNRRREFEDAEATDVALGLLSRTASADVRFHHASLGPIDGIIGVNGVRNTFEKFGEETLIPESAANSGGLFVSEQVELGRVNLSFGARYDHRRLNVEDDAELGVEEQLRTYDAVSGSVGILVNPTEATAIVANLGRGFRAPSTFELFSNGVHEGTARFERGDPALANEHSLNFDLALRVQSSRVSAEVGGFLNFVDNYIYPRPTGVDDPESGFQIFDYTQGDARLYGIEAVGEYHPTAALHLRATTDYTRGQNRDLDVPLAFIPPFRATYSARLEGESIGAIAGPYIALQGETNVRQGDPDPEDFVPDGYTLAHAGGGFSIPVGDRMLGVDVQVRNLFDRSYQNFLSRYKTYALDPGRNVVLRVSSTF
jgi:iron complex outermembrane receptor protein